LVEALDFWQLLNFSLQMVVVASLFSQQQVLMSGCLSLNDVNQNRGIGLPPASASQYFDNEYICAAVATVAIGLKTSESES
jgi:hypothetical protein